MDRRAFLTHMNPEVPLLMFFPVRRQVARGTGTCPRSLRVRSGEWLAGASTRPRTGIVRISFSNGEVIEAREDASWSSLADWNRGRATREGMTLDWLWWRVRNSRDATNPERLRWDFERLQRQHVLESVTVGALLSLVSRLETERSIARLLWSRDGQRFIVERLAADRGAEPDEASSRGTPEGARQARPLANRRIWSALVGIIAEQLAVPRERITPDSRLHGDLAAEPAAIFEVILAAEDEFGVELRAVVTATDTTAGDLYAAVLRQVEQQVPR